LTLNEYKVKNQHNLKKLNSFVRVFTVNHTISRIQCLLMQNKHKQETQCCAYTKIDIYEAMEFYLKMDLKQFWPSR